MKTSKEIRQDFISFFEERGHQFARSSSVVPIDDPTLLFTNAGMNQFKPIFLDLEKPGYPRAVNSQKCIRVSGKHNDLEEVGVDHYHHTFFEMLGNWSFGDYYKAEAIRWAWELLTGVWGMDKERLWVTVYETDDEAFDLWIAETDIDPGRVLRFGAKDNFWEMGETGPCGPCSEIHYYNGPDLSKMNAAGVNVLPEYRELWNLVFIQFNRDAAGELEELQAKHVDTGAGLERIVGVLQNQESNYNTDLFRPIIDQVVELSGVPYTEEDGIPHRVLADHVRMISFSLADGALPSNDGRGYVVRRILRRGARFGRILGMHEPFMYKLVDTMIEIMGLAYPELIEKREHIVRVMRAEESSFGDTLDRGLEMFARTVESLMAGDTIPGEQAFRLYDTFGFPLDLTQLMAREQGLVVDVAGFDRAMTEQRERARAGGKIETVDEDRPWITVTPGSGTDFSGYSTMSESAKVRKYRELSDGALEVTLDRTPFYAAAGGQVGDIGTLTGSGFEMAVHGTLKQWVDGAEETVHRGARTEGAIAGITALTATVRESERQAIRLNHTATHLLHAALRSVLGDHVQQAGSLVAATRLRFDLTHYEKISDEDLSRIEQLVNEQIRGNQPVETTLMTFDEARESGATALFGEKYGDEVRVVNIPGFSRELCGGTHVDHTGAIGLMRITSESALAAGVRRIEAVTGAAAILDYRRDIDTLQQEIVHHKDKIKALHKEIKAAKKVDAGDLVADAVSKAKDLDGLKVVAMQVPLDDVDQVRDLAVDIKHRLKSAVVTLGMVRDNKPQIVVAVTDDLKAKINAGELVKRLGKIMGGGGGGSPIMASAGGRDAGKLGSAISAAADFIKEAIENA